MRFLADMPISRSTVEYLRTKGHDAIHLLDLGLEKAKDVDIVRLAVKDKRILLTMDLDFSAILAACKSEAPSVIIFRLQDNRPNTINHLLNKNLSKIASPLRKGVIAVIEESRIRIRKLPI